MARARVAAVCTVVLFMILAAASVWVYPRSPTGQSDSLDGAATPASSALAPQVRVRLRAWLTESTPVINAVVIARNNIAAAAAGRDVVATGTACQSATGAVADLHHRLPSPEPALTTTFAQVISDYDVGLPYCIGAMHTKGGNGMQQAAAFITRADAAMRTAFDFLEHVPGCEPRDVGVVIA
jgi:hypothetical protein